MMEEIAKVIKNHHDGWVSIEVERKSACHSCAQDKSCGTATVAKAFSPKKQTFAIETSLDLQSNEMVKIGLPETVILKAAALVYILPLFGFFALAVLGTFLTDGIGLSFSISSDFTSILFGTVGALVAFFYGKSKAKLLEVQAQPIIISRLGDQIDVATHRS
ncbi:Fis family transcriptional regulator [Parashewanella spongiae]|uniref:Fis family transcriptional regulator n=1 Tax=Parashewanella spongiae TaxID=342950 RepID=A0A3A6U1E2_9GAMM|nr:SoxR reducing system RseC family protein [Parashewanella spongiae]MCL1079244.1 SoxR reducing system RseC family protein [Parashewanella spongiae]RJY11068.1 Fis family transcriptional regulator [Parashewanella spongiae]